MLLSSAPSNSFKPQNSLYSPVLDVNSKIGAPLKQNRTSSNSSFPVNSMALQGVPLTAGGFQIIPRHSTLDVQAAAQLAASQLFGANPASSPEEKRKNKGFLQNYVTYLQQKRD